MTKKEKFWAAIAFVSIAAMVTQFGFSVYLAGVQEDLLKNYCTRNH